MLPDKDLVERPLLVEGPFGGVKVTWKTLDWGGKGGKGGGNEGVPKMVLARLHIFL